MSTGESCPADPPFIEVRGLTCAYRLGRPDEMITFQGVDLEVGAGERIALRGPSGSGKTTLLKVLAGLKVPAAGRALVGGLDLAQATGGERDAYRRLMVGYVAQEPERGLWPTLTALQNVQAPMLIAGLGQQEREARAVQLLEAVGLRARPGHLPSQLAGGERLRLGLAVALANRPPLLLLDEPGGELDQVTTGTVLSELGELTCQFGVTTIVATRNDELTQLMNRVAWLAGTTVPPLIGSSYQGA
jgi:putative ABC transport system ATP-binding protein